MGVARNILLWISRNETLRKKLPEYGFIRKSVSRFMPGEEIDDALNAAELLRQKGIPTVLTHLGENVKKIEYAQEVTEHYLQLLDAIKVRDLDAQISVKLTEMGLDQNPEICYENLKLLLQKADRLQNFVWIDMEGSSYTSVTLELFQRARSEFSNVGLCLQSYLYRTAQDLDRLLPFTPDIRLVKGAYAEPAAIAFSKKKDNDENYFKLAQILLQKAKLAIATHDEDLIRKIASFADAGSIPKTTYEIQMLYGIRSEAQIRFVKQGFHVRVLISYGSYWFPWYMRRLAERPANVWFVLKNLG